LIWLVVTERSESELATKLDTIIFADFFGYFLISLLFVKDGKLVRWGWLLSSEECFKIAGYLIRTLIGGWFAEEVAGWPLTIAWMLGLRESIAAFDVELARGEDRNLIDVDHFLWNPKRRNTLFGQLYAKFMEVDVGI